MIDTTSIILKLLITFLCFFYGSLFVRTIIKNSAVFFCGIGEFSIGLWTFSDIFQFFLKDTNELSLLQTFIYIFAEFAICSLFVFTNRILNKNNFFSKKINCKIFAIPFLTIIISFFYEFFTTKHLFLIPPEILPDIKYPAYSFPKRPYYYFHCAFCYIVICYSIIKVSNTVSKYLSKRKYLTILYSCTFLFFLIISSYKFFIENFHSKRAILIPDYISSLSILSLSTITFVTLYFHTKERNLRLSFEQFYYTCEFPIIIFSTKNLFLDANNEAQKFFSQYNIEITSETTIKEIFSESQFLQLGTSSDFFYQTEFYISNIHDKQLYLCKKIPILSFLKNETGYYISIIKMNFFSTAIGNLKYKYFTDELTGCKNQKEFERIFVNHVNSHEEPLILITAKINNLDYLNKVIGLKKTDLYIMNFANILKNSITINDIQKETEKELFRLTGSTFALIASINQKDLISNFFKTIKKDCKSFSKNRVEPLTCSLGYSLVMHNESNSQKALQKSFENMLLDSN